jgi:hypothetical protein
MDLAVITAEKGFQQLSVEQVDNLLSTL